MWHITSRMNTDKKASCQILIQQAQDCSSGTRGTTRSSTSPYSTTHPWLLCIFSFKCFLSLVLDCSTNNQGIRKVLKWRAARKLYWKACGVNPGTGILLALRFEGMAMEDFKPKAKPCQFCTVFCKQVEVTPSSGKGCQVVKIQVERQRVAVGFSRAAFMGELKCVDGQHLAWLVVSLGTVKNINGCSGHLQSQHWNLHEV